MGNMENSKLEREGSKKGGGPKGGEKVNGKTSAMKKATVCSRCNRTCRSKKGGGSGRGAGGCSRRLRRVVPKEKEKSNHFSE